MDAVHADHGSSLQGAQAIWSTKMGQELKKKGAISVALFLIIFVISALIATSWVDMSIFPGASSQKALITSAESHNSTQKNHGYSLNCSADHNTTQTCPKTYPTRHEPDYSSSSSEACPEYFRWIYQDLEPWRKSNGISKDLVESGKSVADIRIVVVNGRVYMEKYRGVFQTRDVFTVWGILQLLRLYPGKLPDLDLMFGCGDRPVIRKRDYRGVNAGKAPPMFHYCGDESSLDLVFPDWSFWGWPEINIKPWESLIEELEEGNNRTKWVEREPYAYWKGNSRLSKTRRDLMKCNLTDKQDSNARLYTLAWNQESRKGFKHTNLAGQCVHRYKIYVEGVAWSVSEKYILACDSMTLLVNPRYYDFFTRSLIPTVHYWPISQNDKCRSVKFAVDWGNSHPAKAQEIGKEGSKFIQEELQIEHVYDYMFHLLNEYAKLLKYKPTVPPEAVEICSDTMACKAKGLDRDFMTQSMVKNPSNKRACTMPPPYNVSDLQAFLERKANLIEKVKMWEATGNFSGFQF
ncbi:unnamed protein product [Ilex paraguariensis]|uniref:Glycosyl transferase CAP10 domain-containing protein n=1 Tax=Ilex paraguariensis TaxID=185542 RepID=A0ABC8SW54_9AQUA